MRPEFNLAVAAARRAGAITQEYYGGNYQVADKGHDNPVTSADLAANTYLSEALRTPYPEYGWLSEETADAPQRLQCDSVWIVDPIDGTKEFLEEIPEYVVSIALVEGGEPVVGVIYNPPRDELYAAVKGGGTFLNGRRVFCSQTPSLAQATMIVSRSETKRGEIAPFMPHLKAVEAVGSVAYKLAVVAAGGADLNISVQPKNEWDVVAGDLLVREAGGHMLDLAGQVRRYNRAAPLIKGGLAAGNPALTAAVLELIEQAG